MRREWDVLLARVTASAITVLGLAYIAALIWPAYVPEEARLTIAAVPGLSLAVSGLTALSVVRSCNGRDCGKGVGRE